MSGVDNPNEKMSCYHVNGTFQQDCMFNPFHIIFFSREMVAYIANTLIFILR
jgi:hypothetical protein